MSSDRSVAPGDVGHSTVEDAYFQAWGKAGGAGRVRRAGLLHGDVRRMIELQIQRTHPELSDGEVQRRTAKRMYLSDDAVQPLLDRTQGEPVHGEGLSETMERIARILEDLAIPFHFTGGIAASYYGDPRLTQDLDLVIQLTVEQPETRALFDRLASGYVINEQAATAAIKCRGLFQAIDEKSMVKIDFHVGEKIPGELGRSRRYELFPGLVAPLVAKEDAILSKLMWIQQGSVKAGHDVRMMLKRPEELDRAVLHERAAMLGILDLLAAVETGG
jgi:hypothetical protein